MATLLVHGSPGRFGSYSKYTVPAGNIWLQNGLMAPMGAILVVPTEFLSELTLGLRFEFASSPGWPPMGDMTGTFHFQANALTDSPLPAVFVNPPVASGPVVVTLTHGPGSLGVYSGEYDFDISALIALAPTHIWVTMYRDIDEGNPPLQIPWIHTLTCSAEVVTP